jgi:hypothetical protein
MTLLIVAPFPVAAVIVQAVLAVLAEIVPVGVGSGVLVIV